MVVALFDDLAVLPVSLDDLFETDGFPILQFQRQHRVIETGVPRDGHSTDCIADKRRHSNRLSEFVQSINGGLFAHDGRLIAFLCNDRIRKVDLLTFGHLTLLQNAQHFLKCFAHLLAHDDSSLCALRH